MEGSYLSELVDPKEAAYCQQLNLIVAPCGAGKTTFAIEQLATLWGDRQTSLYLIDTVAGKEQLLQNPKCQRYEKGWRKDEDFSDKTYKGKITVMTYAQFGTLCKHFPKWYWGLDTIICDEIHKLFEMRLWGIAKKIPKAENVYDHAWEAIFEAFYFWRVQSVVAMTATPTLLYRNFSEKVDGEWFESSLLDTAIHHVPLNGVPRHYEQRNIHEYNNLTALCNRLPADKKGILYIPRIAMMEHYQEILQKRGINAVSIWSPHNQDHWMTKRQYETRNYIIENAAIPETVDVLLINKSCETSINIKSHVDYIVVHSGDPDVQTQTVGRYRNDLDDLYLYNVESWEDIELPEEMLGVQLFKEDIIQYVEQQNVRDEKGRLVSQPTFISYLKDSGYDVVSKKVKGGKRYHIVTEKVVPKIN